MAMKTIWLRSCESLYANPDSWLQAVHPDDRAELHRKYGQLMSTLETEVEYRILRPDGSIRWIASRSFPVHDAAGRVVRIAGIATDVTARRDAEQELRESERRFGDMLQNVELASVMLDGDAKITYCNDYLLRLTGWQHADPVASLLIAALIAPRAIRLLWEAAHVLLAAALMAPLSPAPARPAGQMAKLRKPQ